MDELVLLSGLDHPASAHTHTPSVTWRLTDNESFGVLPVGAEAAGDAQDVHGALQLQLPAADGCGDEAAGPTNPSAAAGNMEVIEVRALLAVVETRDVATCSERPRAPWRRLPAGPPPRRPSAAAAAAPSRGSYGRATTCTSSVVAGASDSHTVNRDV